MTALSGIGCLSLHTSSLQGLIELLALTARYDIILLTMENNHRGTVLVDIAGSTQTEILVRLFVEL